MLTPRIGGAVLLAALVALVTLPACSSTSGPSANLATGCVKHYDAATDYFPDKAVVGESVGFSVTYHRNYKVVTNTQPSTGSRARLTYVLVQCGTPKPALTGALRNARVVTIPVHRVVTMSTTYLPMLDALGATSVLAGVDNFDYVNTASVRSLIAAHKLRAVGNGAQANLELLASIAPDLVMTQSTGDESTDGIDRMQKAGTNVVVNSDWLEQAPLGRAEWVKFISLFVNKEELATRVFDGIATRYRALARRATATRSRPGVIMNVPFQGTWFVPGGNSFSARLIRDAGGAYPFSYDHSTGGLSLDLEAVFSKAGNADVWLADDPTFASLAAARKVDSRFADFAAFKSGNVWNNDKIVNKAGGNDFFETAALRADELLADLIEVLHPELEHGHVTVWLRKVPPG